jgi:hypothetical protein
MVRERPYNGIPGLPMLLVLLLVDAAMVWMLVMNIRAQSAPEIVFASVMIALASFLTAGLFMVNPNENTRARRKSRGCAGPIHFSPRRRCHCACGTSRARI